MPTTNKTTKSSLSKKSTGAKFSAKPTVKSTTKPAAKPAPKAPVKTPATPVKRTSLVGTKKPTTSISQKAEFIKKIATQAEGQKPTLTKKVKREPNKIPVWVWVFFGASLLLFCIALYQSFLRPSLTDSQVVGSEETPNIIVSGNEDEWDTSTQTPTFQAGGPAFLQQFYQTFSQKDATSLLALFDAPLQKSTEIKQFFSNYKIVPFIDNITNNSIFPENIELISTSPSGVEEYRYNLNYHLEPSNEDFAETRVAKVKFTDNDAKIASIRCESTRCSYNPFFRPESYGLVK